MVFSFESLSAFVNVNLVMTSDSDSCSEFIIASSPTLLQRRREGGVYLVLGVPSSETVSFFLPFLLRAANTLRPLAEAMRSRKPCLLVLFLREGWNVRFIVLSYKPNIIKGCKNEQDYRNLQGCT